MYEMNTLLPSTVQQSYVLIIALIGIIVSPLSSEMVAQAARKSPTWYKVKISPVLCLISLLIFILISLVTSPPQNSQTASNHIHSTTRSSTMQLTKMIEMASSLRNEPLSVMISRFRLKLQLYQSSKSKCQQYYAQHDNLGR